MNGKGKRRTWPLALLGLGALTVGAWAISEKPLEERLRQEVSKAVSSAGGEVQVAIAQRDVVLKGEAPSEDVLRQIKRQALAVYGVRRVDATGVALKPQPKAEARARAKAEAGPEPKPDAVSVAGGGAKPAPESESKPQPAPEPAARPAPAPPPAPSVNRLLANKATPEITGRIAAPDKVRALKVELAGRTYEEGDGHLLRKGEVWVLVPAEPLPEGTHDVKVIALGEGGASSTDDTSGEVVIDLTPPAAAQPEPPIIAGGQVVLRGSWAEGDARLLRVIVGDDKFDIDAPGSLLMRDGDGRFKIILPSSRLPELRKALFLSVDKVGNVSEGRLPEQPGNACQQQLNDVLIQDMIHFRTGSAEISEDSLLLLDKLAAVLKGCPNMEVLIVGHTDNVGDLASNQQLSEARANAVRQALVERGLRADHVIARGEGETQPLVANDSGRNRQINRRIEITVRPRQQ